MKTPVLAAMACLALTALPAAAAPIVFNATGGIVDYTVPVTGQYTITAVGAKGGDGSTSGYEKGGAGVGGLGAEAGGTFALTKGEMLQILVGAAGTVVSPSGFAGGGGGSFVVGPGDAPLVAGGGGGGGGAFPATFGAAPSTYNGGDGLTEPNGGSSPYYPSSPAGGSGGADGQGGFYVGSGQSPVDAGRGFNSFPLNLGAGAFGGGGLVDSIFVDAFGNRNDVVAGAGGGGGYSGGAGGSETNVGSFKYGAGGSGGGGGGSFTAGADPILLARIGASDGLVTITADAVAVPEPGTLALFGLGLFGLGAVRQARRG